MTHLARILLSLAALTVGFVTQAADFTDQRVFTRGEVRERLDRAREDARLEPKGGDGSQQAVVPASPKVPEVRLQGFIRRSGGPPAVWVNDASTLGGDRIEGSLTVESGRIEGQTVLIRLPDGRSIRLKPGQRYDPDTGKVMDALRK